MNGAQAVAEVLRREGVEQIFCFPSNPLIDAAASVGIRPVVAREERSVLNMADAYTRVRNGHSIGVVMVQSGPGAEHAFGGVAQAYFDSVPLLVLPGGVARGRLGLRTSFDAVAAYRPVTKWAARFTTAASVADQLRRAYSLMRSGRPGPVVLEMPADVLTEEFDEAQFSYEPPRRRRSAGDPADVTDAVARLLSARAPVLHVGQGVLWAEASEELVAFAECVDVPVMTTYTAKSAFPEDHPLALGAGGAGVSPGIAGVLPDADLVFSIGASLARSLGSTPLPAGKAVVQCTNDPDDLAMEYPIVAGVVGDAKLVLVQLLEEARRQLGAERRDASGAGRAEGARAAFADEWAERLGSSEVPINPLRVVAAIRAVVDPAETIITHDSGYPRDHLAAHYVATRPRGYLGWGNTTPLGSSIGLALGAKAAAPDKLVINVMGDAAFGQSGMNVETGVRHKLPILTVLINNSEMGNYEKMQPVAQERFGIKYLTGAYGDVARALGAVAMRVEDPGELEPSLEKAIADVRAGHSVVFEVVTRPEPAIMRL